MSFAEDAQRMIGALAAITETEGQITRLFLSPEHRRAADLVALWMREAGLSVSEDALGTVIGRRDHPSGRRLLIGSHIDTVRDAGAYDGTLGVIAGILAAGALANEPLPFGLDVLAFGDEEGSRFPTTLTSSKAVCGDFDAAAFDATDATGHTLRAAIVAYGKDPQAIRPLYRPDEAIAYLEAHIEQGPVLEARNRALGVVTALAGQERSIVTVTGTAGHAGTVPMDLRQDALAAAAEMITAVETVGRKGEDGLVATVGRIEAVPGAGNVIAARVEFSLDVRARTDGAREAASANIAHEIAAIAARRSVTAEVAVRYRAAATACEDRLQRVLETAIGGEACRLVSGAGHDGHAMARLCPIGMLFVRCRGGISHNPAEYASPSDMGAAVDALVGAIRLLAGRSPGASAAKG